MFKRASLIVGLLLCVAVVRPGSAAAVDQNAQVDAAKADALEALNRQVLAAKVTPGLTVEDLIEKIGGREELAKALGGAQQIGGARWLGDDAVQVRLSIDGGRIARTLLNLVEAHAKESPVAPDALKRQIKWWADRIFTAIGTSTSAGEVARLRPPPSERSWWKVSDADRQKALLAARDSAVDRILKSIGPVALNPGHTIADALRDPAAARAVKDWLDGQPVESVKFNDDLSVRLTLGVALDGFWPVLKSALERQHQVTTPSAPAEWDRVRNQVASRLPVAEGVASVQSNAAPVPGGPVAGLPQQAPKWVTQIVQAQATSPKDGSALHTTRKAETLALDKLRDQVNQLPLSAGATIGAAAGHDPAIEQAVTRALNRARPYQVDYGSNGSVTVYVSLRLSDVWSELGGQQ